MKRLFSLLAASALIGLSTTLPADATLTTIGTATYGAGTYDLIYDDTPGLIWLDYSNPASTWDNQMLWVSGLNGPAVLTYDINPGVTVTWGGDWRLPDTNPVSPFYFYGFDGTTSGGYNITSSEMGHLFYTELGNLGYYDASGTYQPGWGLVNAGPFDNLQPGSYWSGTEYALQTSGAWYSDFRYGYQQWVHEDTTFYALAVRPGDVAAASVPEPGTMMLMGSAIAGFAAFRKRLGF